MALACGFLTVVVTSLMPLACNMCINAAPVNSPPLSCMQRDGQDDRASQLFSKSILMCLDDLLLMCITSARLDTVSMHVNA